MQNVTMNGFQRVTRGVARKLHAQGATIWLTNCKLAPANMYSWMAVRRVNDATYTFDFDAAVDNWTYYNANNEWGYYPAFYVRAS